MDDRAVSLKLKSLAQLCLQGAVVSLAGSGFFALLGLGGHGLRLIVAVAGSGAFIVLMLWLLGISTWALWRSCREKRRDG